MSFSKNLTITVKNTNANLNEPLYVYEKDRNLTMYFRIIDYKYKFDKNPTNILASVDDIMEAYATIVDPNGYELTRQNGEVIDDEIKFVLTDDLIDEIDEIGTYRLQFHIKCEHSEFTIPEISFEVLERLKGHKTVTDESVVGDIVVNNSESFIDEEGKLQIVWQKGDTISSVRLNQMVEVVNNAVDEEHLRKLNEQERVNAENIRTANETARTDEEATRVANENTRIANENTRAVNEDTRVLNENARVASENERKANETLRRSKENERQTNEQTRIQNEEDRVTAENDRVASMNDITTRFNALTSKQQQDAEVIDARDGETSLKARLDRDIEKAKQVYVNVEGSNISTDSSSGYAKDVEILGNTIQDSENLADIRSLGDKVEGQELYEIPVLSRGKNLFNGIWERGYALNLDSSSPLFGKTQAGENYSTTQDFIKVSPNETYYFTETTAQRWVVFYDKDKKPISHDQRWSNCVTPNNTAYIKFYDHNTRVDAFPNYSVSTIDNVYEPYQEDKLTILSPVQLEKVGDVADRIIEKDGVWGVEKNVETVVFNGSEVWYRAAQSDSKINFSHFGTNINNTINNVGMCNKFINSTQSLAVNDTLEVMRIVDNIAYFNIQKKSLASDTVAGWKDYVSNNNLLVKYITTTPQFIPLPHSQQVKLRTFAGQTNIHFETEIEPTIKAQVPKSIGATVNTHTEQISNLNKELDRVKKLEESTVSTVETESDFTTVEATSNGYFEGVKLEGKTLVNLSNLPGGDITLNNRDGNAHITPLKQLTSSDTLYLTFNCTSINSDANFGIIYSVSYKDGTPKEYKAIENDKTVGCKKIKIIPKSDVQHIDIYLHGDNSSSASATISDVMLMYEKDYDVQNPPSYFEGLKSVGQSATTSEDGVDEIVVSSVNKNLDEVELLGQYRNCFNGGIGTNVDFDGHLAKVKPNASYRIRTNGFTSTEISNLCFFDKEFKFIKGIATEVFDIITPNNCYYLTVAVRKDLTNIQIEQGEVVTEYTPHQSDKKRLLYYNNETQTWEKPILREWDSIEKHADGKYYYHQRSGEVVLNGSEDWGISGNVFITSIDSVKALDVISVMSNNFTSYNMNSLLTDSVTEGIAARRGITRGIGLKLESIPTSLDNRGKLQQWLRDNPTTVVYQLAEEKVYECTNIDLITYANETNYVVNTGAICPKSTLKVMCNINNVVRELQQKVSNLENYIQHVMIDALNNALNE